MNTLSFLIVAGLGLLSALIGIIMVNTTSAHETMRLGEQMFDYGLRIGGFVGFLMLLRNGTLIKTKYFNFLKGTFAIVIIGVLLKIMHWTAYANHIIAIGLIGIVLCYGLSFLKKPIKKRLDYIKLVWVITYCMSAILLFFRSIPEEYAGLGLYVLWLAIIDFAITKLREGTLLRQH